MAKISLWTHSCIVLYMSEIVYSKSIQAKLESNKQKKNLCFEYNHKKNLFWLSLKQDKNHKNDEYGIWRAWKRGDCTRGPLFPISFGSRVLTNNKFRFTAQKNLLYGVKPFFVGKDDFLGGMISILGILSPIYRMFESLIPLIIIINHQNI